MRKYLLSLFTVVFACLAFVQSASAQQHITGKIVDTATQEPLIGASVLVKGTNVATSAGLDGGFKLNVPAGSSTLVISYIGYVSKQITISGNEIGTIQLAANSTSVREVTITGDIAIDRKTPVAVTSIGPEFIEEHIGNGDIPELLTGVPGVFTTQGDGGYGDSRVSIRGFSSRSGNGNVAYTVNGIPVNDPETGALYWSDFSGITDVARSIQVQRGLGASKIIVPSFGGTVNVTTRTTDQQAGGFVSEGIGSDGWNKTSVLVSTGLNSNGWAATFGGSKVEGAYPFQGSNFHGYDYFFNLSKVLSPSQILSFTLIGADQTHGQRPEQLLYPNNGVNPNVPGYTGAPQGVNWNEYYGFKDGQPYNPYNNFYSEPILSLNHEWTIDSKSSLSTVLYALLGDGGGGAFSESPLSIAHSGNLYTPVNYTSVEQANALNTDGQSTNYAYDSHDKTHWYGLRSTYRTMIGNYIDLSAGIDLRYYEGNHYEQVTDLFGGTYVVNALTGGGKTATGGTGGDVNNPNNAVGINGIIDYHNIDYVESGGAFAQAEYSKNNFTAFVTLSGSENADRREDPFDYLLSDPAEKSKWVNFTTYQAKAGANYNISSDMNVFANIGYLTKPPYFAGVFVDYTNQLNPHPVSEKLLSYELGYQYKISQLSFNLDLFRTSYRDRAFSSTYSDVTTQQLYTANISGVDEMHEGIEATLHYRPVQGVLLGVMASVGDYYYTSNTGPVSVLNNLGQPVSSGGHVSATYLKNEKIGDVPQNTYQAFAETNLGPQFKVGASVNYYTDYTSFVPFQNYTSPNQKPYIVPNYAVWNMNAVYKFKMAGFDSELIGTVNNLLNSKVITDAEDYNGNNNLANLEVYWLNARTFTTTLKVRF